MQSAHHLYLRICPSSHISPLFGPRVARMLTQLLEKCLEMWVSATVTAASEKFIWKKKREKNAGMPDLNMSPLSWLAKEYLRSPEQPFLLSTGNSSLWFWMKIIHADFYFATGNPSVTLKQQQLGSWSKYEQIVCFVSRALCAGASQPLPPVFLWNYLKKCVVIVIIQWSCSSAAAMQLVPSLGGDRWLLTKTMSACESC